MRNNLSARFGQCSRLIAACFVFLLASAGEAQTLVRGPYLQLNTPTSAIVRWRTDDPAPSVLQYGTDVAVLDQNVTSAALVTDHEVFVSGLQPDTRYFYSVGDGTVVFAGGDSEHFFATSPPVGDTSPRRFWILGDSGTADPLAEAVRDAYGVFNGSGDTDLVLFLGDNAYEDGTDQEYQDAVFDMYPDILRQVPVWPTIGNHDRDDHNSPTQDGTWFDLWSLPAAGEAGGISSGTEAYYSFDYGNVHFIVLDSFDTNRSPGGPMLTWLEADLAATTQDWIIAYWHHPPYSKGSHDSDDDDEEIRLVQMRENALPILESYGVDLVLAGHSHSYERSYLLDGHYGYSNSFDPSMQVDSGDGREDGDGPYVKAGPSGTPLQGAVYSVAGSAGKLSDKGDLDHPAMHISLRTLGSLVLDVNGSRLDGTFVDSSAAVGDRFTIVKGDDTFGPNIISATAPTKYLVELTFSEALNELSAETLGNYTVAGATVEQVILLPDGRTVRLALASALPVGQTMISVSNVTDKAGNAIAPNTETNVDIQTAFTMRFQDGVSPSSGYNGARDAYISEDDPDSTFNLATILSVDGDDPSGSGDDKASLLAWDVSQVPSGTIVVSAAMTLEVSNPSDEPYSFYALQRDWVSGEVSWNEAADGQPWSLPGASGVGDRGAEVADPIIAPDTGTYNIPLNSAGIALVQGWIDDAGNNAGIIIADSASENRLEIDSSDTGDSDARPELVLDLTGGGGNEPPFVDVGPDLQPLFPAPVIIDAFVADDGLPFPPGGLTLAWSQISGPGAASFAPADSAQTTVTFPVEGTYVLRLDVSDGELTATDELTITTNSPGAVNSLDIRISASDDDAEEGSNGIVVFDSTDLDITTAPGEDDFVVGLVFRGLTIPEDATILDAWIQFQVDEASDGATTVLIDAEAADSSAGFADSSYDVSNRPRTLSSVEWSPPAWDDVGDAGSDQRTPGLESIVQEIVDRAGWVPGNDIAFIISGQGDRVADAFDGNSSQAVPLLHVEYKEAYENVPPTVNAGSDQTVIIGNTALLDGSGSDDGWPYPPGTTTWEWTEVSGPGKVTFGDADEQDTTATFSKLGVYVLRLTGDDSELQTTDDLQITVTPIPNMAPLVDAGVDQVVSFGATVVLNGAGGDDGLPDPPAQTTYTWSVTSGPGTVTFADANAQGTTAAFSIPGVYVLRLTGDDSELQSSDDIQITVEPPLNAAPTVDAGGDQTITPPEAATLDATAGDDGFPIPPGATTWTWSVVSGPGPVNFADTNSIDTSATFVVAGTYVLRLTGDDSELQTMDEVQITVNQPPNAPPTVNAGPDQNIDLPADAVLNGTGSDDGWPNPPGVTTWTWSVVSGPDAVTFANANAQDTTASFASPGVYVLRLTGDDSAEQASDDIQITVNLPSNQAPDVDTGPDQSITLPNVAILNAAASDDGLPNPPSTTTWAWSVVSGPGAVSFVDASSPNTSATFTEEGVYVLRLTGDDTELQASDDMQVTAILGNPGPSFDLNIRVADSDDDAEEDLGGNVDLDSTDLDLIEDRGADQIVGLRFQNVAIPAGAIILDAWIQFQADEVSSDAAALVIEAEAVDSAAGFSSSDDNLSDRQRTLSSVAWSPPAWDNVGDAGAAQRTPNMASLLQEIVDRQGWDAGNDMAFIITGTGERVAEAYEGDPAAAPLLHVDYKEAYDNVPPTVNAGSDQSISFGEVASLNGNGSDDGWPSPPGTTAWTWSVVSGPGAVTFADANAQDTTATFAAAGVYVLRLTGDDSELQTTDDMQVVVNTPSNAAPIVDAGIDQTVTLPNSVSLDATGSDDGYPDPPATTAWLWSVVSGPGTVIFGNVNVQDTSASFTVAGVYVLRLTGDDSEFQITDEIQITVNPPLNNPPTVDAGVDQTVTLPDLVLLNGTGSDDGLPNPPAATTWTWSVVSGPDTVSFADANAQDTLATFTTSGTYILRLTGDDSESQASDDVQITVNPLPNDAPTVDAGVDQTVILPDAALLDGAGSDDGLPNPPAATTWTWSVVSGPDTVSFADANAQDTSATFTTPGVYVLRFTGDDSQSQTSDDVQVTVNEPPNMAPVVDAGPNQSIATQDEAILDGTGSDDGWPDPPGVTTWTWSVVSGDGSVSFADANALSTTALFSKQGIYVLRLTGDDSELQTTADVQITVANSPNLPPIVDAGPDQTITFPSSSVTLDGTGSDDGKPNQPGVTTWMWSVVSGPDAVTFGDANALDTTASFAAPGVYVLRLTGDDSAAQSVDDMQVTVNPPPNTAPTVDAGSDQFVLLSAAVALDGSGSDDGLPNPPGAITYTWSVVSGPGSVSFFDVNARDTTATFTEVGVYVLRLTGDDSDLQASDDVEVTVSLTMPPPTFGLDIGIAVSEDDAEEFGDGTVDFDSTDIDLIEDFGNDQVVGLRFRNVMIPVGATILDAWIQFQVDEDSSDTAALVIEAVAVDSAAGFTNAPFNVSTRPRTLTSVAWSPPAWDNVGDAGPDQRTPNLDSLLQEVVDRPGWVPGNNMAFIITGTGERVAEAYDGQSAAAPLLHIEYIEAAENAPPTVDAGNDQTIGLTDVALLDGTGSDDGLPSPPGTTTWIWSMVSGPGTVTFADANAQDTSATFSEQGEYLLRLTGHDSELQASDDMVVTVTVKAVQLDIDPTSPNNIVHPHHNGNGAVAQGLNDVVSVVVLGSSTAVGDPIDFVATDIDPASVRFGPSLGEISPASSPDFSTDYDSDGLTDAKFDFLMGDTGIACTDTTATLVGELTGGVDAFTGTDSIDTQDCTAECHGD